MDISLLSENRRMVQKLASQVVQWRFMCFLCENIADWHDKLPVRTYNYHQFTKLKIIYMQSDKVVLLPILIVLPIYNLYYTISCFSWQYQRRHRYASEIKKDTFWASKFVSKEQEMPEQVSRNGASDTWSVSLDMPWEYLLPVLLLHCTLKYTEGRDFHFFVIFRNLSISFTTRKLIWILIWIFIGNEKGQFDWFSWRIWK